MSCILKKLYKALVFLCRINRVVLTWVGHRKSPRDELNFVKFIERLRNKFALLFTNALRVQCLLGYLKDDEWYRIQQDIRFEFASDSYFTESKENEVLQED